MNVGRFLLSVELGGTLITLLFRYFAFYEKWTWRMTFAFFWWIDVVRMITVLFFYVADHFLLLPLAQMIGKGESLLPLPKRTDPPPICPDCGAPAVCADEVQARAKAVLEGREATADDIKLFAHIAKHSAEQFKRDEE